MSNAAVITAISELSPALQFFMTELQPRQRRSAGINAAAFEAYARLRRSRPQWENYDLLTLLLAAVHLVFENDRLTGNQPRSFLISELSTLAAFENPQDPQEVHREMATAVLDALTNASNRSTRHTDRYLRLDEHGCADHGVQSFHLLEVTGDDDSSEPVLKASSEAINFFQNLYVFDPFDRAAAERYRSQRMLERRDYDEVLSSVHRRAASLHVVRGDIEALLKRMTYNVGDVGFTSDVEPRLEEARVFIDEQLLAEEQMAATVASHKHHHAPDLPQLERIGGQLDELIASLMRLHSLVGTVTTRYEHEQDRQLFTHRTITVNPQHDLLLPLLQLRRDQVIATLEGKVAHLLGVRTPRIWNLRALADHTRPQVRGPRQQPQHDPFALGPARAVTEEPIVEVMARVQEILNRVARPTAVSELINELPHAVADLSADERALAPWVLAVIVASGYGPPDDTQAAVSGAFDHRRYAVVKSGDRFETSSVAGDELFIIPRQVGDYTPGASA